MQNWDVIRLVPGKELSDCGEQFGKACRDTSAVAKIQLNEHIDGGRQGKDVVQHDDFGVRS